jgi:hypothetical protein
MTKEIDLTRPETFTRDAVAALIASKDDSQHRQLRVSEAGEVYISDEIGNLNLAGVRFSLETWLAGNEYTGREAAADPKHVERIYRAIETNWAKGTRGIVVMY